MWVFLISAAISAEYWTLLPCGNNIQEALNKKPRIFKCKTMDKAEFDMRNLLHQQLFKNVFIHF